MIHNEVEEINGIHNCESCACNDLKLYDIEWVDTGDEGITMVLRYKCRACSKFTELVYACKELSNEELLEFYDSRKEDNLNVESARKDVEREIYKRCDEEDRKEAGKCIR